MWSINILLRIYIYLADSYKKIVEERRYNLYGTRKIEIPILELYELYLGNNKIKKKENSLNEEYFDGKGPIDLKVKIITVRTKNDILKEFLVEHKDEVMSIQTMLFDQDYVSEMYDNELFEEGIKQD